MNRTDRRLFALLALFALFSLAIPARAADAPEVRAGCELDFRPYCFTDEHGRPTGFGPDLLEAVAQKMGLRLRTTAAPWDEVWSGLVTGALDVLPVVARTAGREPLVDFCLPHTETFDAFFVRRSRPALPDLAAAAGKQIVVLHSDAAHHELVERRFSGTVIAVESIPEGLRLVAEGRHDAFLCSKLIGTLEIAEHGIQGLAAGPPIPDYKRVFSFAVRKGNVELAEKLNQGLLIVKASGEYDRIYARWMGGPEAGPPAWWQWSWRAVGILGLLFFLAAAWRVTRKAAEWDERLLRALTPQPRWARSPVARYALALAAVAAATALRWLLIPWLGTITPYNVWVVAAATVTALLGLGPGLMFAMLGIVATEVFVMGSLPILFTAAILARMGFTALVGIFICVLLHAVRIAALETRRHAERLATLGAATFEGIVESEAGRILDCNEQFAQMLGRAVADLKGRAIADLTAPEDRERVLANIQPNRDSVVEHEMLRGDGTRIVVEAHGRPVTLGGPRRHTAVRDITDRKRAEAALRASERNYRDLFENMAEEVHFWRLVRNEDGGIATWRLVDANPPALRTWGGRSLDEIRGKTADEIFGPGATEHYLPIVRKIFAENAPCSFEGYFPNLDKYFRFTSVPFGEHFITTGADISGIKKAEQALRESDQRLRAANEQLERKVRERTEELAARAEQLRALASQLTLAEQRERRRLAAVLHDNLQQLLVGAKFQLTSLGRSPDEAARRIASQVENLLDDSIECSRSLTGELSPPILHEAGLVAGLEWLAVWMQQKHGLNVDLTADAAAAPESEDMTVLLFQSVRELLFNVAKHARVKAAQVALRAANDRVEITVSDNGVGFDPAAAGRRDDKSGGFGLFSIRERLDLLGGAMEIDSAPGHGSRFTLRAPRRSFAPEAAGPPATLAGVRISRAGPLPPRAGGAVAAAGAIRVLLVDDHVVVRQGLSHLLREEPDMEVVAEASDGLAAVEMVRRFLPDVVTMDVNMPIMDGIEATRLIRAEFPAVQVIGLSMFEQSERAQAMREAGAADFLTKSGPADALVAAIRACARLARTGAGGTAA